MKIYTRKGDGGDTTLFGGKQVPKDDTRVEAYGTVDELNSFLGLAIAKLPNAMSEWHERLTSIQSDCFVLGAILATPKTGSQKPEHVPTLPDSRVDQLEKWIDALDEELQALNAFILPGGSEAAAILHVVRGVCRRAERRVVQLYRHEELEDVVVRYLNRLGDLLFTLARAANTRLGTADVEWHPEPS